VGTRNHVLDGVQVSTREGANLRSKSDWPRTCPDNILKATQQGVEMVQSDANWGIADGFTLAQPGEYD